MYEGDVFDTYVVPIKRVRGGTTHARDEITGTIYRCRCLGKAAQAPFRPGVRYRIEGRYIAKATRNGRPLIDVTAIREIGPDAPSSSRKGEDVKVDRDKGSKGIGVDLPGGLRLCCTRHPGDLAFGLFRPIVIPPTIPGTLGFPCLDSIATVRLLSKGTPEAEGLRAWEVAIVSPVGCLSAALERYGGLLPLVRLVVSARPPLPHPIPPLRKAQA